MKTKSVVRKLMVSYIAVWIPVLIVCLIVSENALTQLRQKEEKKIEEQINQVAIDIVEQYQRYVENAFAMARADELKPQKFLTSEMGRYLGREYLKDIYRFNIGMYEILLDYGQNEVYSVQGTASLPVFFKSVMSCTEAGYSEASEMLASDKGGIYYLEATPRIGYLCYYVPSIRKAESKLSITFIYSFENFIQMLQQRFGNRLSAFCLEVEDKQIYLRYAEDELVLQHFDNSADLSDMKKIYVPIGCETDKVISVYYRSNDLFKEVSQVQKLHYSLICVGVVAASVVTVWVSRQKARRIRTLEEAFDVSCGVSDLRDEYQYLRMLIRNMAQESDAFLKNEATYKRLLLQQNAKLLFHGGVGNREDINVYLRMSGVELCEEYFCVCGYYMDKYMENYEPFSIGDLGYYQRLNDGAIYISLMELPNYDRNREIRLRSARENLNKLRQGEVQTVVIVSRVYDDITKAHEAYREVTEILREMDRKGDRRNGQVIFWEKSQDELTGEYRWNEEDILTYAEYDTKDREKLSQILTFINENYQDCNLTAETVADQVKMNKTYMSRLFKQKMKMTYMEYLTGLRMKCAEKLLLETDKPVSEICMESGYVDTSSFRRKFKQVYGMSVSEYRNRGRKQ